MEFTAVGVLSGARFAVPMEQSSLLVEAGGAVLRVFNPVAGETVRLAIASSGPASLLGFSSHGAARVALTAGGVAGSIATDLVVSARMAPGTMMTGYLGATTFTMAQAVSVMAVNAGGTDYLIATRPAGSGLEVFRINPDQTLTRTAGVADTPGTAVAAVSAMAQATVQGGQVLYAASATEHAITAYAVSASGTLAAVATTGMAQGVPVQGITTLKTVELGGQGWLVAGAAASSSLTVFRIGADGALLPVDHVLDERTTRFDAVTALDAIAVGGRIFVVAAGADDGVSLLTLLPDGTLLHLSVLADTTALGLAKVTDLRLGLQGGVLQVFALSGAEAGMTQLSVDLRTLGATGQAGTAGDDLLVAGSGAASALSGGAGRDVLMDGSGNDTLTGGAGADIFVLTADARRDVITDFDIAQDRIDLSRWAFFRNATQLQITSTATGAVLRFFGEEVEVRSHDGRSLTEAALRALDFAPMTRLPLIEPTVEPAPVPVGTIQGSAGNDTLGGTAAAETLIGLGGDDLILTEGGADTVYGGAGSDWLSYAGLATAIRIDTGRWASSSDQVADDLVEGIEGFIGTAYDDVMIGTKAAALFRGGAGNDTLVAGTRGGELRGEDGDDSLTGGAGAELLWGGAGNDALLGGASDDTLDGGAGNDRLFGGTGNDSLSGGDGDDWTEAGDGDDRLEDGIGNDTLYGGAGTDALIAGAGADWLYGDAGDDLLGGGTGNDRLFGGIGNDRLGGDEGDDLLEGGDGDDTLTDGSGEDTLYGGAGGDVLGATLGNDWLYGDAGDDMADGGAGNDRLFGGTGNDSLAGSDGDDRIEGGDGNDSLGGGSGSDTVLGGAGADRIAADAGNDWLSGEDGDDWLDGGTDDDRLFGGTGNDWLSGGAGRDTLDGDTGDDLLYGGAGDDRLDGGAGGDALYGLGGADVLIGGDGDDTLNGGSGDDHLTGGAGRDRLSGSTGRDRLDGGADDDYLSGFFGADWLYGGDGSDTLDGGGGNDLLVGDQGADVFLFAGFPKGEVDMIADFQNGADLLRFVGIPGSTDAERFATLSIRAVTVDGTGYAEITRFGHAIRLAGVAAGDLTVDDFLFY